LKVVVAMEVTEVMAAMVVVVVVAVAAEVDNTY
jgi:hypothetical protein